jgi:hypothetical protein
MFSWIPHRASTRPEDVIQGLSGSGPARWQRASELADMLRSDRHEEFRQNSKAALQLADLLDRELTTATTSGGMAPDAVNLRYFMCRALGEFEVTDGLEVLLKAATTGRDPREQSMRRGAIQAIAVLAYHQLHADPPRPLEHPDLEPTLIKLASDDDELIRSETAFALGRIGTPTCLQQLEIMVNDPHTDTRYNAAIGLAQHGNANAVDTLAEMLDADEFGSVREESDQRLQPFKRAVIMKNAMQAATQLSRADPNADLSAVHDALSTIAEATPTELREALIDAHVQAEAVRTLEFLEQRDEGED